MSRDIKFRAWVGSKMITPFIWINECNLPSLQGGTASRHPLMQFTGLTDKNGKEIYESDVVYLSGYGEYLVEFPFLELYEAYPEGDIGEILGNIYEDKSLIGDR